MADGTYEAVGEAMAADARRRSVLTPAELARENALHEIDDLLKGLTEARRLIAGFEDECASRPNTKPLTLACVAASHGTRGHSDFARKAIYEWVGAVREQEEAARRAKFARAAQ